MTLNTNLIHNILNFLGLFVGAFIAYDWSMLGFSAETAVFITAWFLIFDKLIKLGINIVRDGLFGLMKNQPPVE